MTRSCLIRSGSRILPNVRLMSVVVSHKMIFMSITNVFICVEFFDRLLRPVNTVFTRELVVAFQMFDWFGSFFRITDVVETAKDHVMISLSTGVIAFPCASTLSVFGLEDAMCSLPTAHGVDRVPSSRRMRSLRMELHFPMFFICTHSRLMEGYVVFCASVCI